MVAELGGLASLPEWLAPDTLERAQAALESGLARETWKYSPLSKSVRSLIGAPATLASPLQDVPDGVVATPFSALETPPPLPLNIERYPLAGFTVSLARDGWLVDVQRSPGCALVLKSEAGINAPVVLNVRPGCQVEIHESARVDGVQAALRVILAARDSRVTWAQAELSSDAEQWSHLQAHLEDQASLELHQHAVGARFRRFDTHVTLRGAASSCQSTGTSVVGAGQHLDRQQVVEHIGRNTHSHTKLHNVAAGKSRCSFNGRIHIHAGANGTDADLSNKNLALDVAAEINTKPELEIYTDDVRCAHGATVGQLDNNALFYLRSRGLPEPLARRLLCAGFLAECIKGPLASSVQEDFLERLARISR